MVPEAPKVILGTTSGLGQHSIQGVLRSNAKKQRTTSAPTRPNKQSVDSKSGADDIPEFDLSTLVASFNRKISKTSEASTPLVRAKKRKSSPVNLDSVSFDWL